MGVNRMLYQGAQAKRFTLVFRALPPLRLRDPGPSSARAALFAGKGKSQPELELAYAGHPSGVG